MESKRAALDQEASKTKPTARIWAYGAAGETCGWYPEHFVKPDGFALADFPAAIYGPEYLALKKDVRITRMSEAGWAYDTVNCKMGWFPIVFVQS